MQANTISEATEIERLRAENAALRTVIDSIPYFVFWKDEASVYRGCNTVFARAAGLRPEQIVGRTDYDMPWTREESDAYRAYDRKVMAEGPVVDLEETQVNADGVETTVVTSKVPLKDEAGAIIGILGVYTDITARKQLERDLQRAKESAEAANAAKGDFLSAMSHEVRTPLALMLGPLEVLAARDDLAADVRAQLASVHRNGWRLKGLLDDVLDFAKGDAGKTVVTRAPVDVSLITRSLAEDVRASAASRGITLVEDVAEAGTVSLDQRMFERMLLNYLGNAVKFTPSGGTITLRLACTETVIEASVIDTGIGIAPAAQGLLFQRFQQVDTSSTRRYGGTGLGLALVKDYAELLGGTVAVTSEPGVGSCFSFTIPRVDVDAMAAMQSTIRSFEIEARLADDAVDSRRIVAEDARPCVVLAEDSSELRTFAASVLDTSYRVITCADGAAALEAARKHRPAVVVTDVMMPEMDGNQLLAAMKADPELKDIPVIVMTAHVGRTTLVSTLESGADDFLEKPFKPAELLARVGVGVRLHACTRALVAKNEELVRTIDGIVEMEKLAALGRMLSQVSHEINNPMCAVLGNIDPMGEYFEAITTMLDDYAAASEDGPSSQRLRARREELEIDFVAEDFRSCLASVREGVDRVRAVQRDLRAYLRGSELATELADVNASLKTTVEILRRALPPDVRITTRLGDIPSLRVNVGQLNQVFLNLLQNSADALGPAGTIEVATAVCGDVLQVTIADDGSGIPPELRAKIFEPFFSTKAGKGSGLGLAVCRQIVSAHGGTLRLDDASTTGARFFLELPLHGTQVPS